jgi:antitoxin (DNA-binding transcriptional repressor) of toxin-antitoxin stability system
VKTISKAQLKSKMLAAFREVERTGEELVVTDHSRPVLKIVPFSPPRKSIDELFADVRGKVVYHEDILAPTTDEWPQLQ